MSAREWQFDGLVGPTHNYAGLALGNVASARNAGAVSNPRAAALQGLSKMRFVRDLGVPQAVLPPHYRPMISELRRLGFGGNLGMMLDEAARVAPGLLASVYSSAFMWTANAATVTPSADAAGGKLHLSIANLTSHYHRSIEADFAYRSLCKIFNNSSLFSVHNALPPTDNFSDEGAANHMRVSTTHDASGVNLFVYGKSEAASAKPQQFPARQHRLASEAIARRHQLTDARTHYLQQSPSAIDAGVFHNDVIALNTATRMIVHEDAFIPEHQAALRTLFAANPTWRLVEVSTQELSVADAVATYLFNSQFLLLESGQYALVAPSECATHAAVTKLIHQLTEEGMIDAVHTLDVRESMRNGGGPACLRLRVVMTAEQSQSIHPGVILTDALDAALRSWVGQYYRDRLSFDDLRDPELLRELERAYNELESILGLEGLYDPWRNNLP